MYYEINVSLNGRHYFATAKRSITDPEKAKSTVEHFRKVFPASEGYEVSCTMWMNTGKNMDF